MKWKDLFIKLSLVAVVAYFLVSEIREKKNIEGFTVIHNDVNFYYSYLPAIFIYGDMGFGFKDHLKEKDRQKIWVLTDSEGNYHSKMTAGNAIMYLPFFLSAHLYATATHHDANGYSRPYDEALHYSSLAYLLIALWLLTGYLRKYFSWTAVVITVLSLPLATNLFYYTTHESAMSHVYSFFLFTLFVITTEKWHHNKFKLSYSIFLGLLLGIITLVRPTNIIIALLPMIYGISSIKDVGLNFKLLWQKKKSFIALIVSFFCIAFIQPLLWKWGTGNWLVYSYGDEGFYFLDPHIMDGLFSYRKGWLVYTPIMIFGLLGMFFLFKSRSEWRWAVPLFLFLHIYIIFSWWCWWYGGSFGARSMIETYAILAIPFAAFFHFILKNFCWRKILATVLIYLFIKLNFFQTKQYIVTLIHWDSMTKEAYWEVFLEEQFPENYHELLEPPDYEKAKKGADEYGQKG